MVVTAGGKVASASGDCSLKVWDLDTGGLLHTLKGHTGPVWAAAVTADGKALSGSRDQLKVWDLESGTLLRSLEGRGVPVTILADGKAVSDFLNGTFKVWDMDTGALVRTFEGHGYPIVVTGSGEALSSSSEGFDPALGFGYRSLATHA